MDHFTISFQGKLIENELLANGTWLRKLNVYMLMLNISKISKSRQNVYKVKYIGLEYAIKASLLIGTSVADTNTHTKYILEKLVVLYVWVRGRTRSREREIGGRRKVER